jgi:sugar (pentulose or hexulose) kinase
MTELLLGIDVGTSFTKVALFGRDGREVARSAVATEVRRPRPGWSEADPEAVWAALAVLIRGLLAENAVPPGAVAAVGVTGAMVGGWVVDAAGRPLRNGILWDDGRAQPWIEARLAADPGFLSRIFACSGQMMQQGCTLPVLRWLIDNEPAAMGRAAALFSSKDFVRMRLTGEVAADYTEAAVAPGSAVARTRSAAMLELFGLGPHGRLLPPVLRSEELAGAVTAAAAEATGLAPGTPVAVGAGDVPATVLGAGGARPGAVITILGTTCLNGVLLDRPSFEPPDVGVLFTVPGDLWLRTMVNVAGTTNLDWCLHALCPDLRGDADVFAALEALAGSVAIGAEGLTYVPYLSEVGIIAPKVEPRARGGFAGLTPAHGRAHLVRAVYEGVALSIRDCYAAMDRPIGTIRFVGGGSRSRFWSQMLADATGLPVEIPEGTEFGAKGAALLAATAIGWFPTVEEAVERTYAVARRHDPDPDAKGAYDAAFARYVVCRDAFIDGVARRMRAGGSVE